MKEVIFLLIFLASVGLFSSCSKESALSPSPKLSSPVDRVFYINEDGTLTPAESVEDRSNGSTLYHGHFIDAKETDIGHYIRCMRDPSSCCWGC